MNQTNCYVCGQQLSIDREIVGYMELRYFTVCRNPQCDECWVEVETVSESEWEPTESQLQSMLRPV